MIRIGIDVGGTFTDFVLFDPMTGQISTYKLLSTPENPARAVIQGMRQLEVQDGTEILHGSTVATNALLERKGARTALITTGGFRDVLAIGRQNRSDIYDLASGRPEPLVPREMRFEVDERVDHRGEVITPLDAAELFPLVEQLREREVTSVAIALLFSFLHRDHERTIAELIRREGFTASVSSEILPEFREYERTSTTVINAYVAPIVERYLAELHQTLRTEKFFVMQSNGGLARAEKAQREAVRAILSGPAGGVVGARFIGQLAGNDRLITFDMGGTSTDVSLIDGDLRVTSEAQVGGFPIRVPVIDIHTVGSGGGSIASVDRGGALRVGPQSAGADPGPVCYGLGGNSPTVTDANLVLGRLAVEFFLDGRMPLDRKAAVKSLEMLAENLALSEKDGLSPAEQAALGIVDVVNAHMARALRVISVERGYDPADFTLLSFGGAGGLHAVELARSLGIPKVMIPPGASTLSAFGMLTADVIKDYVQTVMLPAESNYEELTVRIEPLSTRGVEDLKGHGIAVKDIQLFRELDLRYVGQGYELTVPFTSDFLEMFFSLHEKTYGHAPTHLPIEVVNLRVRAVGSVPRPELKSSSLMGEEPQGARIDHRRVILGNARVDQILFYRGSALLPGNRLRGPSVIAYKDTTVYLPEASAARVDGFGNLIIEVDA